MLVGVTFSPGRKGSGLGLQRGLWKLCACFRKHSKEQWERRPWTLGVQMCPRGTLWRGQVRWHSACHENCHRRAGALSGVWMPQKQQAPLKVDRCPWPPACRAVLIKRRARKVRRSVHPSSHLSLCFLPAAPQKGFDVFNALDLMENKTFLEKLQVWHWGWQPTVLSVQLEVPQHEGRERYVVLGTNPTMLPGSRA